MSVFKQIELVIIKAVPLEVGVALANALNGEYTCELGTVTVRFSQGQALVKSYPVPQGGMSRALGRLGGFHRYPAWLFEGVLLRTTCRSQGERLSAHSQQIALSMMKRERKCILSSGC
ncbi:MAG: hypothetical protein NZM04_00745 [Methylacidiphilales bacterium]|nr:hypothetical protein [Candidatus Methylacidiphilales bacterium]